MPSHLLSKHSHRLLLIVSSVMNLPYLTHILPTQHSSNNRHNLLSLPIVYLSYLLANFSRFSQYMSSLNALWIKIWLFRIKFVRKYQLAERIIKAAILPTFTCITVEHFLKKCQKLCQTSSFVPFKVGQDVDPAKGITGRR